MKSRHIGWAVSIMVVIAGGVAGVERYRAVNQPVVVYNQNDLSPISNSLSITIPNVSDIVKVQPSTGMPTAHPPRSIQSNTAKGESTIRSITRWLKTATPVGYEKPHPMPNLGPASATVYVRGGEDIQLSLPIDSITHKWGAKTTISMKVAKGFVDMQMGNGETLRIHCPRLSGWLQRLSRP